MAATKIFPGADDSTPSRSQYFSWINHTNEGPTEAVTLANLRFFKYLHDEFGMKLDIYAFDAGAIDGSGFYGSTDSERFRRQFPNGFDRVYEVAKQIGTRLGTWGGPDGFGTTPEEAKRRIEMMTSLCRDYRFELFKFDAVCGQLPKSNRKYLAEMMTECRKYSPDLILLNHRLDLGEALPHATTFLWESTETYVDVHLPNSTCAPHNRAGVMARGVPPDLKRACEDHGVCLSSCLDYWDDDLILHAFARNLILAPEIYGNPWLLRDNELPRLARIYNLHRKYRDIMVNGILLPEATYGPNAVSRGDGDTRVITLRNLTWEPVTYHVPLGAAIGLVPAGQIELRQLHPHERVIGKYAIDSIIGVEVLPFRAALLIASTKPIDDSYVAGCDYDVIRDLPGRPLKIDLLSPAGTTANIELPPNAMRASLDDQSISIPTDRKLAVTFPGLRMNESWHRKIGNLQPIAVPDDAEALYEASCFAADNNALEIRELDRSGPTKIAEVQAAREALSNQPLFRQRFLWDKYLFDDDADTAFAVCRRWPSRGDLRIRGGSLRIDFGEPIQINRLFFEIGHEQFLQPLRSQEAVKGTISSDLKNWITVNGFAGSNIEFELPQETPIRYFRLNGSPDVVRQVRGYCGGKAVDRSRWRASNLFASYASAPATHAWSKRFMIEQIAPGSYLALAISGEHGNELAYAGIRTPNGYHGAARRAPSYRSNPWECAVQHTTGFTTHYFKLTDDLAGKELEVVAMLLKGGNPSVAVSAWLTAYPIPYARRRLTMHRDYDLLLP